MKTTICCLLYTFNPSVLWLEPTKASTTWHIWIKPGPSKHILGHFIHVHTMYSYIPCSRTYHVLAHTKNSHIPCTRTYHLLVHTMYSHIPCTRTYHVLAHTMYSYIPFTRTHTMYSHRTYHVLAHNKNHPRKEQTMYLIKGRTHQMFWALLACMNRP
jgi:hypothetical protein